MACPVHGPECQVPKMNTLGEHLDEYKRLPKIPTMCAHCRRSEADHPYFYCWLNISPIKKVLDRIGAARRRIEFAREQGNNNVQL